MGQILKDGLSKISRTTLLVDSALFIILLVSAWPAMAKLVVVSDVQVTRDYDLFSGNETFLRNVLADGSNVVFTPNAEIQSAVFDFYSSLPNVTAQVTTNVIDGALAAADLLVIDGGVDTPFTGFGPAGNETIRNFMAHGGTVMFIAERGGPVTDGLVFVGDYNAFLFDIGSNIRYTGERSLGFTFPPAFTHPLSIGADAVRSAARNPLEGGEKVFGRTVAAEGYVPLPGAIYLFGFGLAVLLEIRKRR